MKEDFLITIVGRQTIDGHTEKLDLNTVGSYYKKDGKKFISYMEFSDDDSGGCLRTIIEIDGNDLIVLRRNREDDHSLILEKGKRHTCYYYTSVGIVNIGVFTDKLEIDLDDDGGNIYLKYNIEFDIEYATENELEIEIKRKEI